MEKNYDRGSVDTLILRVQFLTLLIVIIAILVMGFGKGLWSDSDFLPAKKTDSETVFYHDHSAVAQVKSGHLVFSSNTGKMEFTIEIRENGSQSTVILIDENQKPVRSIIYLSSEKKLLGKDGTSQNNFTEETMKKALPFSDLIICRMVLGDLSVKLDEQLLFVAMALIYMLAGIAIVFFKSYIIKLDKIILSFFYKGSEKLPATGFHQDLISFCGIILFMLGFLMSLSFILA